MLLERRLKHTFSVTSTEKEKMEDVIKVLIKALFSAIPGRFLQNHHFNLGRILGPLTANTNHSCFRSKNRKKWDGILNLTAHSWHFSSKSVLVMTGDAPASVPMWVMLTSTLVGLGTLLVKHVLIPRHRYQLCIDVYDNFVKCVFVLGLNDKSHLR